MQERAVPGAQCNSNKKKGTVCIRNEKAYMPVQPEVGPQVMQEHKKETKLWPGLGPQGNTKNTQQQKHKRR